MKKEFYILVLSLLFIPLWGWSISKTIRPLTDVPDYTFTGYSAWKFPNLGIKAGANINAGFSIKIQFTALANADYKEPIWQIGIIQGRYLDNILILYQKGKTLSIGRATKLGNFLRSYEYDAWDSNMLEANTNYTMTFEIDETRCLITLWKTGSPSEKKYEYTFYGLMGSYLKEQMAKEGGNLAITVNNKFQTYYMFINDLGYGVGVQIPSPKNKEFVAEIQNSSTGLYMGIKDFNINSKYYITQNYLRNYGSDKWKVTPLFKSSRNPLYYEVNMSNLATNSKLTPWHCDATKGSEMTVNDNTPCNSWVLKKEDNYVSQFSLLNGYNFEYAGIKNNSQDIGTPLVLDVFGTGRTFLWTINVENFDKTLPNGFYRIKYGDTGYVITPKSLAYTSSDLVVKNAKIEDSDLWYITSDENGLYKIQNIDSKKYISVLNSSLSENAPIGLQDDSNLGNSLWSFSPAGGSDLYSISNITSGRYIAMESSLTANGSSNIVQKGEIGGILERWKVEKAVLNVALPLGGIFRLGNVASETYISASSNGIDVVSSQDPNDPSTWWIIEFQEDGGYAFKNVKFLKYLSIYNSSLSSNAKCILTDFNDNKKGESLFELAPFIDRPGVSYYWLVNMHSGLQLAFQKSGSTIGTPLVQVKMVGSDYGNVAFRWGLEPVFNNKE